MVTFFTEADLISFGNYMISFERKEDYLKQVETDKLSSFLAQVNDYDIQVWASAELAKLKEVNKIKEKTDEEIVSELFEVDEI